MLFGFVWYSEFYWSITKAKKKVMAAEKSRVPDEKTAVSKADLGDPSSAYPNSDSYYTQPLTAG